MGNIFPKVCIEELSRFHLIDGRWRLYVKPYTRQLEDELESYRRNQYVADGVSVKEVMGTYVITSKEVMHEFSHLRGSLWFMLFWRYYCDARYKLARELEGERKSPLCWRENKMGLEFNDENGDYNYYVLVLSHEFIKPDTLPYFCEGEE